MLLELHSARQVEKYSIMLLPYALKVVERFRALGGEPFTAENPGFVAMVVVRFRNEKSHQPESVRESDEGSEVKFVGSNTVNGAKRF